MLESALAHDAAGLDPEATVLVGAARDLASARDLTRLMEVVRHAARTLARADGVTFVLREGSHVHYADEDAVSPLWKGSRFPVDACISGWAMTHRETVVIEDVAGDERIPHALYEPTFVRSLAMVPVRVEDPVAAIGAYWARRHRATRHEVTLLETLAGLASVALANQALVAELRLAVEARDEFLGIASHELRTPLSVLELRYQQARRALPETADCEPARKALGQMGRTIGRLERLVDGLLDVSRRVRGRLRLAPEPLDLAALLREAAERARAAGALVEVDAPAEVPGEWDRLRVQQVVDALLENAAKFGQGAPVRATLEASEGSVELVVRDRGIGIAPEDQARVFERYERAVSRRHFGGFGLGLWVVRQNVEAHGGAISLESRPGAGTVVTVRLPRAPAAPLR